MIGEISMKILSVKSQETCDTVYREISESSKIVDFPGIAVVVSESGVVMGVVTDGDFRRAYTDDYDFQKPIVSIMNPSPLTITEIELESYNFSSYAKWLDSNSKVPSVCLVTCIEKKLIGAIHTSEIDKRINSKGFVISIYGLGFVGLTLAAHLSSHDRIVVGLEVDEDIVEELQSGNSSRVSEPGMTSLLEDGLARGTLVVKRATDPRSRSRFHIITVGTPVNESGGVDLTALKASAKSVGEAIIAGDHVMLRSTVPVGTTREFVIPLLENYSGLLAGNDFFVSFTPERTAEGVALRELQNLPQVIGSISREGTLDAVDFWSGVCGSVALAESLEEAEMVKLANNTFRDISFAFANELALLAGNFNVDSNHLISIANEGYPRSNISLPSPGVGGYCLTKDPWLYHFSHAQNDHIKTLGSMSREVDKRARHYPLDCLKRYSKKYSRDLMQLRTLIIGVAFKGYPETTDTRGSISIDLLESFQDIVKSVTLMDFAIPNTQLKKLHNDVISLNEIDISSYDAIFIMNNHERNKEIEKLLDKKSSTFIFDGWGQLSKSYVLNNSSLAYANMGYCSFV
jgi:nucleotide sugar dehydrogenase